LQNFLNAPRTLTVFGCQNGRRTLHRCAQNCGNWQRLALFTARLA